MAVAIDTRWNYTDHAAFYGARPNYAISVIEALIQHVGARAHDDYLVADIGAGTGNLTLLLASHGLRCVAVEPNDAMRLSGMMRTARHGVRWIIGTGEHSGLDTASVQWVTMGSSFNTMNRRQALAETQRILKPGGYFTCMWNHRDLEDPVQKEVETLIRSFVPGYTYGTRREDQTEMLRQSGLFGEVAFLEATQEVVQNIDDYMLAWRSTHNLKIHAGEQFETVLDAIERKVAPYGTLCMRYTTRAWTARAKQIA